MNELESVSRVLGIAGYMLITVNMAFWLWLLFKARRQAPRPNFISELILFAAGTCFFLLVFLSVAGPMAWRGHVLFWARLASLLLGIAFSIHTSIVAGAIRNHDSS